MRHSLRLSVRAESMHTQRRDSQSPEQHSLDDTHGRAKLVWLDRMGVVEGSAPPRLRLGRLDRARAFRRGSDKQVSHVTTYVLKVLEQRHVLGCSLKQLMPTCSQQV